jgi:hypothetical protein
MAGKAGVSGVSNASCASCDWRAENANCCRHPRNSTVKTAYDQGGNVTPVLVPMWTDENAVCDLFEPQRPAINFRTAIIPDVG